MLEAAGANSPSVYQVANPHLLTTWDLHDFLVKFLALMQEINGCFKPHFYSHYTSANELRCCVDVKRIEQVPRIQLVDKNRFQFTIISGNLDNHTKRVDITNQNEMHTNLSTQSSEDFSSNQKKELVKNESEHNKEAEGYSTNEQMLLGHIAGVKHLPTGEVKRGWLFAAHVTGERIELLAYNWAPSLTERLDSFLENYGRWTKQREKLLSNIFAQKMGLFYTLAHGPKPTSSSYLSTPSPHGVGQSPSRPIPPALRFLRNFPPGKAATGGPATPLAPSSSASISTSPRSSGGDSFTLENMEQFFTQPFVGSSGKVGPSSDGNVSPENEVDRSQSPRVHGSLNKEEFGTVLRDKFPSLPMHKSNLIDVENPAARHGMQLKDTAVYYSSRARKQLLLHHISSQWKRVSIFSSGKRERDVWLALA